MSEAALQVLFAAGILGLVLGWLYFRLFATRKEFALDRGWWRGFSAERYRPLKKLLDQRDLEYLGSMNGSSRAIAAEFRRRRFEAARGYLADMSADFRRLQMLGQIMLATGGADTSLRDELYRRRVQFAVAMFQVRFGLVMMRFGLGRVDASALLASLESVAGAVRLPATASAAA